MDRTCIDRIANKAKREDHTLKMLLHVIEGKKCLWVTSDYKTGLRLIKIMIDTLQVHGINYKFNISGRTIFIGEGQLIVKSINIDWEKLIGHEFDYYAFPA